jgi:hypothetical protein
MGCDEPPRHKAQCIIAKVTFPVSCTLVIYTFVCFVLLYSTSTLSSSLSHFAATSSFISHIYLSFLSPLLFVCESSCFVTCLCFYVSPVFCLQPRTCATYQVCLTLNCNADTTLWQSHFNGNMEDQCRQTFTNQVPVKKPTVPHF